MEKSTAIDAELYRVPEPRQKVATTPAHEQLQEQIERLQEHKLERPMSAGERLQQQMEALQQPTPDRNLGERVNARPRHAPTLEQVEREATAARDSLSKTLGRERAPEGEKDAIGAGAQTISRTGTHWSGKQPPGHLDPDTNSRTSAKPASSLFQANNRTSADGSTSFRRPPLSRTSRRGRRSLAATRRSKSASRNTITAP